MSRRSAQVLPFTLSELFVLLFFALALTLVWQSNARAEAEQEAVDLRQILDVAESALGPAGVRELVSLMAAAEKTVPDDFMVLVRDIREQSQARASLQSHLREIGVDSITVDSASTQTLVRILADRQVEAEGRADQLAAALQRTGANGSGILACTSDLADRDRELALVRNDVTNARNQAQACFRRIGNGLDHPPCWADSAGRPEYAFTVTLQTSTVSIAPAWPAHRAGDAERTPGITAAIGSQMSYGEFSRRALPVFEWSTRQTPECRHFVRIVDQVDGGKDPFKQNLLTVERFFYKLLAN
jgi:hypothetical protein